MDSIELRRMSIDNAKIALAQAKHQLELEKIHIEAVTRRINGGGINKKEVMKGFEIKNTDKVVGMVLQTLFNRWKIEGIYTYEDAYQIHIRNLGRLSDRLYKLYKEGSFYEGNSNFCIENTDTGHKVWVRRDRLKDSTQFYLLMKDIIQSEIGPDL